MAHQWYIRKAGKEHGPFTGAQLKQLANSRRISADTDVRRATDGNWVRAEQVRGLFNPRVPEPRPGNPEKVEVAPPPLVTDAPKPPNDEPAMEAGEVHHVPILCGLVTLLCLGLTISVFLPWVSMGSVEGSGLERPSGKLLLGLGLAVAVLVWLIPLKRISGLGGSYAISAFGATVAIWMLGLVWQIRNMKNKIAEEADSLGGVLAGLFGALTIRPRGGLYIGATCGVLVTFIGILLVVLHERKRNKSGISIRSGVFSVIAIAAASGLLAVPQTSYRVVDGSSLTKQSANPLGTTEAGREDRIVEAQLGKTFTLGSLEIKPQRIQLITLMASSTFGDPEPRDKKSYVLTFTAKNMSEGQVFGAYSSTVSAVDNFGNECPDPTSTSMVRHVRIEGNELFEDILPGKSATIKVAFDPALDAASEYTWTVMTKVSNQDKYERWRIRFAPSR